jgi:glyoxylate/hydroxypyruvate reductase
MAVLLFSSPEDPVDLWVPALRAALPAEVEVRVAPDVGNRAEIDYALVWKPEHGFLASLPNLKAIFSIAAGVDHILSDPRRPKRLPVVRMVDDYLKDMMSEYAILGVLHFHRYMPRYQAQQRAQSWDRGWPLYTPETQVGVLGLGEIGAHVARRFAGLGFQVRGWSRTPKQVDGVVCHHGEDGLFAMLPGCHYLVGVLPLTPATRGVFNAKTLAALPKGAVVVNLGRGGHVVDDDLLAALESGHLAGAFLDVFNAEPLPAGHPYWTHPKVVVTPHVAGELVPKSCAKSVAANVRRHLNGEPLRYVVDLDRGY